ncbi:hypothetical protein HK107_09745 [Parvularcula sp. ZS-1/3]|uniref:Uncharacterized protein n=1 Tax=Parvularcula mediterranea TaxID=2732508 RepID=A0A7Y3RNN3_9PROT|nr:hypothetical protein [Parvularcula mediterranea]NNU16602.1 hypothetical protein [Parvularcula mediterranea]
MRMTAHAAIPVSQPALARRERVQAAASSLVVTSGAVLAALAFVAALLVSLPLMLAASATLHPTVGKRRGWRELEPVEA